MGIIIMVVKIPPEMKKNTDDFFKGNKQFEPQFDSNWHITKEIVEEGIIELAAVETKRGLMKKGIVPKENLVDEIKKRIKNAYHEESTTSVITEADEKYGIKNVCNRGAVNFVSQKEMAKNITFNADQLDTLADSIEYEIKARASKRRISGRNPEEHANSEKAAKIMYECGTAVGNSIRNMKDMRRGMGK